MPCLGRTAGGKDGGRGGGQSSESLQHCALHRTGDAAGVQQAEPASPLALLPRLPVLRWEAKKPVLGGFPRAHVRLELGRGSKLSLSHRLEWWQPLWLAK